MGVPANRSWLAGTLRFLSDRTAKCQSKPAIWGRLARRSSPYGWHSLRWNREQIQLEPGRLFPKHGLDAPLADRLCFFVRHGSGIALLGKPLLDCRDNGLTAFRTDR